MNIEAFYPESPAATRIEQNLIQDQLQHYVGTITERPEFLSLLDQIGATEQPFQRTLALQGANRASLAIDLMQSMRSAAVKEKLLKQLDAHQISDPMFQRVILGVTTIAPQGGYPTPSEDQQPNLDLWTQVSVLREAMQIDREQLFTSKDNEFTRDVEEESEQARAFEGGYELVIKQYERLLLTGVRSQLLLSNGNS